jgi:DNA-binding response OmpR family regulator
MLLQKVLSENGYVVDSYEDPLLALEKFKGHLDDLVILDIKMPELNGFALYRESKTLDKKAKVCFLTASMSDWVKLQLLSAHASNMLNRMGARLNMRN